MTKTQNTVLDALLNAEAVSSKTIKLARLGDVTVNALNVEQYAQAADDAHGNQTNFLVAMCVHGIEGAPFSKVELMQKYDAMSVMECARKALLPGEVAEIGAAVAELSGFSADGVEAV